MNFHRLIPNIVLIIVAAGLLAATTELAAGPLKVYSAEPKTGIQGETLEPVTIKGLGFTNPKSIRFLVDSTNDTGGVEVTGFTRIDDATLLATVSIPGNAPVAYYDIEVQLSSGRKGKGTTLFKVESSRNEVVSCSEVFSLSDPGSCDCTFNPPDESSPFYQLLEDCHTSETLELDGFSIRTAGSVQSSGTERLTLTAVGDANGVFNGASVISNKTDVASVRYLDIRFDPGVLRGCAQKLKTAVSFVLHGPSSPGAGDETFDDPLMNSLLQVWDITVDTQDGGAGAPLCTAIEVVREPGFTKDAAGNKDWKVSVQNVEIIEGSYVQAAIRFEGMQPQQSINPPLVFGNFVGSPACSTQGEAVGVQFGKILLSDPGDPSSRIAGVVESNIIRMEDATCPAGLHRIGIRLDGADSGDQTSASIVKNVISGADIGVQADANVVDINFSGNTLIGDNVPESGDTGIVSDAVCTSYKGKPNRISDYDFDTDDLGCN